MKRVFALFLCLCMALSCVPAVSAAETGNVRLYHNYKESFYDTVEEALSAASAGDTVALQADITAGQVVVPKGVTLDLNGFALTADLVFAADGYITDTSRTGKIQVAQNLLGITGDNNGVLPVWNPGGGYYVMTSVVHQQMMKAAEDLSSAKYIFIPNFALDVLPLLGDGSADNGISVKVQLTWNDGASKQYYTFNDQMVQEVYGSANANGVCAEIFQLTVTGISGIDDMTICVVVESAAGGKSVNVESKVAPAPNFNCACSNAADADQNDVCDLCQGHIHHYSVSITAPTCNQGGYSTYTCWCAHSYVADAVPASGKHVDSNKDKLCDRCRLSVIVELDFYSVNDLHGAFVDTDSHPGVDEFTTYMKQKYADTSTYEILLSAGDMWQGSVESSSNKGALMTQWMNELDFVAMTIGNHEYDWGSAYIAQNSQAAEFPFLAINIRENGKSPSYCQPSVVVERGGVKIGIIGAMGNHVSSISGEFNRNLQFLTGSTLTTLVKNESNRLRQEEGCDLIIYVLHSDEDDYDYSLSNGYVDLVFEGHTHTSYIKTDSYGVVHIQSGGYNEGVSFVNIAYNVAEDTYKVETKTNLSSSVYGASSIKDDPFVEQIFQEYFPDDNPYTTVLGKTSAYRSSSVICQEVANQYLEFGQSHWSNYDIVLAGGFLQLRSPKKLYAGNVTYAQLFTLMPFDNSLVLGKISGSKLKSKFINGSYYVAKSDSMPTIKDNATYYIVVDTYTAYYASNGITIVDRYDNYYARDLIADFVKSGGWS